MTDMLCSSLDLVESLFDDEYVHMRRNFKSFDNLISLP